MVIAWYDGSAPPEGGDIRFGESIHWSPSTWPVDALEVIEDWYFDQEQQWNYENPKL